MKVLRVEKDGMVTILNDNGSIHGHLRGAQAVDADINSDETFIAVARDNGLVTVYNLNGSIKSTIRTNDATKVKWSGDKIAISGSNGKMQMRRINGSIA